MKDKDIIALYECRDEAAIVETQKKYGDYCFTIAQNILKVTQDSEECLNDMYNKAWQSIPPQKPAKLGAWLAKVIRNLSLNLWQKNHRLKRYKGLTLIFDELEECIPGPSDVEKTIEGQELTAFIDRWLGGLDKEDRVLFLRRYWYGQALKDLEKAYKTSHGKMAKRMYVLRANLKDALEKGGYQL